MANGIVVCGDVMKEGGHFESLNSICITFSCCLFLHTQPEVTVAQQQTIQEAQTRWLRQNKIRLFYSSVLASSLRDGCRVLYQTAGLGKLRPNVVLTGFKNNWRDCTVGEVEEFVTVLKDAFAYNMGVGLFRLRAGFDATEKSVGTPVGGLSRSTTTFTPRASADMGERRSSSLSFRSNTTHEYQPLLAGGVAEGEVGMSTTAEVYPDMGVSTFHRPREQTLVVAGSEPCATWCVPLQARPWWTPVRRPGQVQPLKWERWTLLITRRWSREAPRMRL